MIKENKSFAIGIKERETLPQITGGEFRFIRQQAGIALGRIPRRDDAGCYAKSTVSSWERQLFVRPWQVVLLFNLVSLLTSQELFQSARISWQGSKEQREWIAGLKDDERKEYYSYQKIQQGKAGAA